MPVPDVYVIVVDVHAAPHVVPSVEPVFCNLASVEPTCVPGHVITYAGRAAALRVTFTV